MRWDFTVLALGILSMVPVVRATEVPAADTGKSEVGEQFAPDVALSICSPLQSSETLSLGVVAESSDEAAEADKLAKQLANPISSLISVPFQANEECSYGPSRLVKRPFDQDEV